MEQIKLSHSEWHDGIFKQLFKFFRQRNKQYFSKQVVFVKIKENDPSKNRLSKF